MIDPEETGDIDSTSSLMTNPAWRSAACKGQDTNLWFSSDLAEAQQAVKICNSCPIKEMCYDFALDTDQYGIWGGHPFGMKIDGLRGVELARMLSAVCRAGEKICQLCRRINDRRKEEYPLFVRRVDPERNERIYLLHDTGHSVKQIVKLTQTSQRQVYRILKERSNEAA